MIGGSLYAQVAAEGLIERLILLASWSLLSQMWCFSLWLVASHGHRPAMFLVILDAADILLDQTEACEILGKILSGVEEVERGTSDYQHVSKLA